MIFDRYKKSFPAKLSLYVISFITILSFVLVGVFYHYSTETLLQEAEDKIESMAAQANLRVSALLSKVEKIPENLGRMIVEYVKEPDSLFGITRRIVKDNPEIFGCVIAFEPYYFPEKGHYFAPYSYMVGDSVKTIQVGGKDYNYFEKGWYNGAREHRYWSKPYRDAGDPDVITTSYAVPVHGEKNELIGILSVDLTNRWLRDLVDSIKPYKGSYTVVIDKQGRYILRREGEVMIGQNMFETAKEARDTNVTILVNEMAAGKSGSIIVDDGGVLSYVYYTPVVATDWYMAVICPYDQVFGKLSKFNMYLLVGFVLLLLFVYFICFVAVRRITKPLTIFAASARDVAQGNFNTPLPRIRSKDELGELYESFLFMQQQLTEYVDQLRQTTTANEKIESELRIAHDIQLGMVPKQFVPTFGAECIDIHAVLHPARQVGGDLYDYLMLNEDEFGFAIGDVSGKGVPASLFMATTISQMRSLALRDTSLNYIMNLMNQSLIRTENTSMFITFFAGVLNLNTNRLRFCNAGHPYPLLIAPDGTVSFFKTADNLPLGVTSDYDYEEQECYFAPGSQLLFYTDGVSEAQNEQSKFYKIDRLFNLVASHSQLAPRQMVEKVVGDVKRFVGNAEQSDDLTVMSFRLKVRGKKKTEGLL